MANVLFKRGVQANLPSSTSAIDGVFYLTTDTNRLYVGQGNNLKLLNQVVQFIDSLDSLNSLAASWTTDAEKSVHVNDFYYITGGNILATYIYDTQKSQYRWEQINPDTNTVVTDLSMKATSAGANAVSVVTELTQTGEQVTTATMAVRGGTGIHVIADNDALVINGETYSMTAASTTVTDATTSTFFLTLNKTTTQTSAVSTIPIVSTNNNITFAQDGNEIKITGKDTILQSATATLGVGTLSVTFEDSSDHARTATLNNVGILLNDNTYAPIGSTSTATSQGSIYSKAEIDTMLNGLDGMTYKGTIGTSGATVSALPTTGVKNGDTYVIVTPDLTTGSSIFTGASFNAGTIASMAAGTKVGDMLIASGTETNGVIPSDGITWTYIPAGNDSLDAVTYSAEVNTATHSLKLKNVGETGIAKIGLIAGDGIALSSIVDSDGNLNNTLKTTITHATYTTSALTATTADRTATFTALKAITTTNGHVVGYQEETFIPVTYNIEQIQASSENNTATVSFTLSDSGEHSSTAAFAINSSSLKVSGSNSAVTVDIEWGSFDN